MANDANIFKRGSGSDAYVVPEIWRDSIEKVARESNMMLGLKDSIIVEDRSGSGAGDKLNIPKNSALSAAVVTDGNSIGISAVSFTEVEVTSTIKGVAVQLTLKQLRDQLGSAEPSIIENLGLALAEKEEDDIFTELYTTGSTDIYVDDKTEANITTSETLDYATIVKARTAMRSDNRKPLYLIVHPEQMADLLNITQFTYASYYGSSDPIMKGEIGRILGMRVIESTNVQTTGEGVSDDVTVYNALVLGDRALVFYLRQRPTFEMNRNLIQDLSVVMQAWEDYGVQNLNDASIRVVKSA
jgi:N4-gp56 family major capsid protein